MTHCRTEELEKHNEGTNASRKRAIIKSEHQHGIILDTKKSVEHTDTSKLQDLIL